MRVLRIALLMSLLLGAGLTACGDDDDDPGTTTTTEGDTTTTTAAPTTTTSDGTTTSTSQVPAATQPAVWPVPGAGFDTPEAAAEDFVSTVLGVAPVLGPFQAGDARSGEIEVLSPGEGGEGTPLPRGRLLLRQLGPDDGWYVLAAVSEGASIEMPETGADVPPGPVSVQGQARGFEGTVVVSAFPAGDAAVTLAEEITQGGPFGEPEPYDVTLDLSAAEPGGVVALLVRGGTGLASDPGDFAALPVVVSPSG